MERKIIHSLVVFFIIIMISTNSYAGKLDNIIKDGDNFIDIGTKQTSPINETALQQTSNEIFNMLYPIAVAILLGVGMLIGITFIVGSVEEKAKMKEILIPYAVGAIVIFGAFIIWKTIIEIMQSL